MSVIDRRFRLAESAAGLGLCCAEDGVFLAGVALLRKGETAWIVRPTSEIEILLKAAYDRPVDPARVRFGLQAAAKALNEGDLGRAMVASLQLRLPDVQSKCAERLAQVDGVLAKYDPQEPRDWRGRWTTGGSARSAASAKPSAKRPAVPRTRHSRASAPPAARPSTPHAPLVNSDAHGLRSSRRKRSGSPSFVSCGRHGRLGLQRRRGGAAWSR